MRIDPVQIDRIEFSAPKPDAHCLLCMGTGFVNFGTRCECAMFVVNVWLRPDACEIEVEMKVEFA